MMPWKARASAIKARSGGGTVKLKAGRESREHPAELAVTAKIDVRPFARSQPLDPTLFTCRLENDQDRERSISKLKKVRRPSVQVMLVGLTLASAAGVGYMLAGASLDHIWSALPGAGCNIKGNISFNTGERIYHVPGQVYYHDTTISMRHGERWFCSEAEARRAGWRKSNI